MDIIVSTIYESLANRITPMYANKEKRQVHKQFQALQKKFDEVKEQAKNLQKHWEEIEPKLTASVLIVAAKPARPMKLSDTKTKNINEKIKKTKKITSEDLVKAFNIVRHQEEIIVYFEKILSDTVNKFKDKTPKSFMTSLKAEIESARESHKENYEVVTKAAIDLYTPADLCKKMDGSMHTTFGVVLMHLEEASKEKNIKFDESEIKQRVDIDENAIIYATVIPIHNVPIIDKTEIIDDDEEDEKNDKKDKDEVLKTAYVVLHQRLTNIGRDADKLGTASPTYINVLRSMVSKLKNLKGGRKADKANISTKKGSRGETNIVLDNKSIKVLLSSLALDKSLRIFPGKIPSKNKLEKLTKLTKRSGDPLLNYLTTENVEIENDTITVLFDMEDLREIGLFKYPIIDEDDDIIKENIEEAQKEIMLDIAVFIGNKSEKRSDGTYHVKTREQIIPGSVRRIGHNIAFKFSIGEDIGSTREEVNKEKKEALEKKKQEQSKRGATNKQVSEETEEEPVYMYICRTMDNTGTWSQWKKTQRIEREKDTFENSHKIALQFKIIAIQKQIKHKTGTELGWKELKDQKVETLLNPKEKIRNSVPKADRSIVDKAFESLEQ